eukprot:12609181-Ditylum_brightwellii.AAC.1
MHRVMEHCRATPKRGWRLNPTRAWDGKDKSFKKCKWMRNFLGGRANQCQGHYTEDCGVISNRGRDYCRGAVCIRHVVLQTYPGKHGLKGRAANGVIH